MSSLPKNTCCVDCGAMRWEPGRSGHNAQVRWLNASENVWKYVCEPCRVMRLLAGDATKYYDLEDY